MIWKGVGMLGGVAALVVGGVVGVARLTVPDVADFADGLGSGATTPDGSVDFVPTAIGGELGITGARVGTMILNGPVDGPSYGLGGPRGNIFFETDPMAISQMAYDGLAFFPEPSECVFTPGAYNDEIGLAAVRIECAELSDIRGDGTITVDGYAALPADLVLDLDLPETGGTVTVGDEAWESASPVLFIGPDFEGFEPSNSLYLTPEDEEGVWGIDLAYDGGSETLSVTSISHRGAITDLSPGDCSTETTEIAVVNPQVTLMELTLRCDSVQIASVGDVSVSGDVIFERVFFEP